MIQVGEWIHTSPKRLSCEVLSSTQLNSYKNRVQEPFLRLMVDDVEVMVNGRAMLWSLLDSLFPSDPLPRTPVLEMLKHNPNEFLFDLNSFFDESVTPYISIMLGEIDDPYSTVGKKWSEPGAILITHNTGLKAPDCVEIADKYKGQVVPGTWKDSKGNHSVPCVLLHDTIHIHDLGSQLVIGSVLKNEHGSNVRPLPPTRLKKKVGWPSALSSIISRHIDANERAKNRIYPNVIIRERDNLRTSEVMAREHELFQRGHD